MTARTAARLAFSKAAVVQGQLFPLRKLCLSSSPPSSIATATSALLPHLSPSQSPVAAPPRQVASLHPLRHFSSSFGTSYARPSTALAAHYSRLVNIQARLGSSAASLPAQQPGPAQPPASSHDTPKDVSQSKDTEISQYWGIVPKTPGRVDGTTWPWACFQPSDTYSADLSIDMSKHHQAEKMVDKLAQGIVNFLRIPVDLLFRNRHVSHALLLETVAAVPGMVGGMLLHCRSLRRFEHSGGWIKALLDEAENERMHLMTWTEVLKPNWLERALVLGVQGGFFNAYFLLYLASPRLAHRFVGYLEEEAVKSYTEFLEAIDKKEMPNAPAPLIAIDYWRLPKDATVRDVVLVIRADEAHHRDVNHFAADIHGEGKELREFPAPIGYH